MTVDAVAAQLDDLVLAELDRLAGVRDERGDVAAEEVLAVADARRPAGELRRAPTTTSGASACTATRVNAPSRRRQTRAHGLGQVAGRRLVRLAEQVRDDLGVGVASGSLVPARLELGAQRREVLDDAVVDHGDPAGVVEVRVGVAVVRRAVRGPARVPDADAWPAGSGCSSSSFSRLTSLPARLRAGEIAVGSDDRDAGGVVAAVLQPAQTLDHDVEGRLVTDVSHDAAHAPRVRPGRERVSLARARPRRVARRRARACSAWAPRP